MLIIKLKKRVIRTVLRHIRARLIALSGLVNPLAVQPLVKRTTVVENAVQNHLHAALVRLLHQVDKQFIARLQVRLVRHTVNIPRCPHIVLVARPEQIAFVGDNLSEMRINIVIILNIILMVRWRNKHRIQINDLHTEILQIIHLVNDALQIAAVEIADIHLLREAVPVIHLVDLLTDVAVLSRQHIVGRISVAEAVHKNLIHDSALRPVRRMEARDNAERVHLLQLSCDTELVVITDHAACLNLKKIADRLISDRNLDLVIIKTVPDQTDLHLCTGGTADEINRIYIIFQGTEPDLHRVARVRLKRNLILRGFIAVERMLVEHRPHL